MVVMKPGELTFNVGDFLWQEINNSSENPQRLHYKKLFNL
jgi:hypothetical protein